VTLSTGEEVCLREKFTHGDEVVFSAGKRKGVTERRVVQPDGTIATERTPDNLDAAIEDTLLVLIESVKGADGDRKPTLDWLRGLLVRDFEELVMAFAEIRKASAEAVEAGKKNRG
jgi:hypothetical protein